MKFLRCCTLSSPIKFKHITLNLLVIGKEYTVSAALVNATMCINTIGEPKVHHLTYWTYNIYIYIYTHTHTPTPIPAKAEMVLSIKMINYILLQIYIYFNIALKILINSWNAIEISLRLHEPNNKRLYQLS